MRRLVTLWIALALTAAAAPVAAKPHASPRLVDVAGPGEATQFARFETSGIVEPEPENPFDPTHADVWGHFRDPSGREWRMPGFWFQDFDRALVDGREVLTPRGEPGWRVRFSPTRAGTWTWWWTVRTPDGEAASKPKRVKVASSSDHGFVRRSSDSRYLAFEDGTPWFAVGENVGWYDARGSFAYDSWYTRLAEQGATYARLWMPSWAFGIEWSDTGLGDYRNRLGRAWQLDHVVSLGEQLGIRQVVSLLNHGAFSQTNNSEWAANPYNAANGGPLGMPGEVFTNAEARDLLKRRFRYIVARWGYSTAVLTWELWNEADLVTPYVPGASAAWHAEMASYLRELDPYDHLVSTSFAFGPSDGSVWASPGLDYTQFHFYSRPFGDDPKLFPNLAQNAAWWMPGMHTAYQRPTLLAEFGVDARGPAETFRADPEGIGLHDGLWAGALNQTFGTGMSWWWDNYVDVEPDRFYPMFGSVARFLAGTAWHREGFARSTSAAASATRPLVVYGLQGPNRGLVWIKNDQHQWTSPDWAVINDATAVLNGLAAGRWCGEWWNTWAGQSAGGFTIDSTGTPVPVAVPAFAGDVALRLSRCS